MSWAELCAACGAAGSGAGHDVHVTLRLDNSLDDDARAAAVFGVFAVRDDLEAARLMLGDHEIGVLLRGSLLNLLPVQSRGVGIGDGATLPGEPNQVVWIELRCPEVGCPRSPVWVVNFDPGNPPACAVHPLRVLAP